MDDDDLLTGLSRLSVLAGQLACATAAVLREVNGRAIPAAHGAPSTPVWLRERLRISIHTAHRMTSLARLLDTRPALREGLADGMLNPKQATVIGTALDGLPDGLDPAAVDKAEALLVDHAHRFEPVILRRLDDASFPMWPRRSPKRRYAARSSVTRPAPILDRTLSITPHGSGRTRLSGWLDAETTAILTAALDPPCQPTPRAAGPDPRTPGQRRADALGDIYRLVLAGDRLPDNGGHRPQLTITTNLDTLTRQLGPGLLDTGQTLSPATVRRLACDARIIPTILGSNSTALDMGRTPRAYTGTIRHALILRDGGCAFPGCDRPPRWCQAHHITHWLNGETTNLDNEVPHCGHHHRTIHHGHWTVRP